MAIIEIMIQDDHGNLIEGQARRTYKLELGNQSFNAIETAVGKLKNIALPDLKADLLKKAQDNFIKKNGQLKRNGNNPVKIKTLDGGFEFKVQRFVIDENHQERQVDYFELTDQFQAGYFSDSLKEFAAYYSNRLSYEDNEQLIRKLAGSQQISDQQIHHLVVGKALEVSQSLTEETQRILGDTTQKLPPINERVNIYEAMEKEILLMDDAIQVKGQKATRERKKDQENQKGEVDPQNNEAAGNRVWVRTDVVLLEKKQGGFEYVTGVLDNEEKELLPLAAIVKSKVIQEYGDERKPLNIVAITDGAKNIRGRLLAIFGVTVVIILDWFHLDKKVRELMSMIAPTKADKESYLKFIFHQLWQGQTEAVLNYLRTVVKTKNPEKLSEMIGYIEKHQSEIIDYQRRQRSGKIIGSGRIEKCCDQVIGHRQKKKAMSWSKIGSGSLGILKVAELNNQWRKLWFSNEAANDPDINGIHPVLALAS